MRLPIKNPWFLLTSLSVACLLLTKDIQAQSLFDDSIGFGTYSRTTFEELAVPGREVVVQPDPGDPRAFALPVKTVIKTPWEISLDSKYFFDTNIGQNSDELEDWHWDSEAKLRYYYKTGGGSLTLRKGEWLIVPMAVVGTARYDDFSTADKDVLQVGIESAYGISDTFSGIFGYKTQWAFTPDFDKNSNTNHAFEAGIRKILIPPKDVALPWSLNSKLVGSFTISDPSDYDNAGGTAALEFKKRLKSRPGTPKPKDRIAVTVGAGASYGYFDSFFPDVNKEDREFLRINAAVKLDYSFCDNAGISVGVVYVHSEDRLSRYDFDRFQAYPAISLKVSW